MANLKSKYKFIQEKFNECLRNKCFKNILNDYFKSYTETYLNSIIDNTEKIKTSPKYICDVWGFLGYYTEHSYPSSLNHSYFNVDLHFRNFNIKNNVSISNFHKIVINFIPYAFNRLKEDFYTQLNIDKNMYDIEINKIYNYIPQEKYLLNYLQQYPFVLFDYMNIYSNSKYHNNFDVPFELDYM